MNKITKIALGLFGLPIVAVSAISTLPDHLKPAALAGPSSLDADIANNRVMLLAEDQVRRVLKDPDSAKFGSVHLIASSTTEPLSKPEADIVCGFVNGKNSFGAYTGASRFILLPGSVPFLEPNNPDAEGYDQFFRLWNKECAGKQPVASL